MIGGRYLSLGVSELKRRVWGNKYILEIDATNRCNLSCVHCYHFKKPHEQDNISIKEWEIRFNKFYRQGVRLVLFVGGEPALRQDVLFLASRIFLGIGVISNGTVKIDPSLRNLIIVSVDGKEETNDKLRGEGVFELIRKNYSADKRVVLNCVLSKLNYKEVPDIIKAAMDLGVRGAVFDLYTPDVGEDGKELFLDKIELEEVRRLIYHEISERGRWVYMTRETVDRLVEHHAANECFWRDFALHYDVHLNRRHCFSSTVDCSRCGCIMGAWKNPFRLNPKALWMTVKFGVVR